MVSSSEGSQVGTVGRSWVGHTAVAARKQVTELVGDSLQLVSRVALVVMNDVVVTWLAGSLGALKR